MSRSKHIIGYIALNHNLRGFVKILKFRHTVYIETMMNLRILKTKSST